MRRTVVLIILDGWGIGKEDESNPIHVVQPKSFKFLEENYPLTSLQASGISVGLPWGEVGNSEVGHLTLGAGKVVYQYYPRITMSIQDGTFFENPALMSCVEHVKKNDSTLNLAGLLSKGNVHASIEHVKALLKFAEKQGISKVKLHLFADGKDMPPKTLEGLIKELPQEKIATVIGRYYAMDREGNWRLTKEAYDCMVGSGGILVGGNLDELIKSNYAKGLNEEFLVPLKVQADCGIKDGDALFFFNYREDSIRQIAMSFIDKEFDDFPRKEMPKLHVATMSHYMDKFNVPVAYPPEDIKSPLGKVISDAGLTQLRLAESYKYAHITYFFNGYIEAPLTGEYRVLVPSEPIPHPDEHPQMMAAAITDRLIQAMENRAFDFILVNYANGDTIAHSGNYHAALEAVKTIDTEIGRVIQVALNTDAVVIITSDHGNMEELISPATGRMETQHDPSPVPFYLMSKEFRGRKFINWRSVANEPIGIISDVAPTILQIMGLKKPEDMSGRDLLGDLVS